MVVVFELFEYITNTTFRSWLRP